VDPELSRVFLNQIRVQGVAMGTVDELRRLAIMCAEAGIEPAIDSEFTLADAKAGIERMVEGRLFGKVLLRCSD
jgi:D-arabinose 1-dehydrogenase-like Zn-dependent alcohol dehydrogenase